MVRSDGLLTWGSTEVRLSCLGNSGLIFCRPYE
jgi:hypothetical protein